MPLDLIVEKSYEMTLKLSYYPRHLVLFTTVLVALAFSTCTKDYLVKDKLPTPKVGVERDSLIASFIDFEISSINDAYWKEADFLLLDAIEDLYTNQVYSADGRLNLTGTYNGILDFNEGTPASVTLKAAYSNTSVYILAEWTDQSLDAGHDDWLWDGPEDPLKTDTANGWTSQRNDDKLSLIFDIDGAMSGSLTFSNEGCAASCHNGGSGLMMAPESGSVDIWNWSMALSSPFGYALDMHAQSGVNATFDQGNVWFQRNGPDPNDFRSGPSFEWSGMTQNVDRPLGGPSILDPAWFVLNKSPFIGDAAIGANLYVNATKGCDGCHGEAGKGFGPNGDGPPFDDETFSRKFSRQTFKDYSGSEDHSGKGYYDELNATQADHLIAYIRGLAGVPGYYVEQPTEGQSITDLETHTNVNTARINRDDEHSVYQVLFKRKLDTGFADDVKFDPAAQSTYIFGLALMDHDGKNHVGSLFNHLIFEDR